MCFWRKDCVAHIVTELLNETSKEPKTTNANVLANVSHLVSSLLWVAVVTTQAPACCCVSIQGLHRSEEHLKANYVTTLCKGSSKCTAAVLRGLTYPKILCATIKEERKREDGDIAWR